MSNEAAIGGFLCAAAVLGVRVADASPTPSGEGPRAEPAVRNRPTETSGLAASAGLGTAYGGLLGSQLAYYVALSNSFRLAPYAAVGASYAGRDHGWVLGAAGGVLGSIGRTHRFLVDLGYGATAVATSSYSACTYPGGTPSCVGSSREDVMWGPWLAVGYEYMNRSGFFLRADLGVAYHMVVPAYGEKFRRFTFANTPIGLGWKFW